MFICAERVLRGVCSVGNRRICAVQTADYDRLSAVCKPATVFSVAAFVLV